MKICITGDLDWANDVILRDYLDLFIDYEINLTLFSTHESELLKNNKNNLFEIGIHPNHNETLINGKGDKSKNIISSLLKIYPNSKGVRSHSLTYSSGLLNNYKDLGLRYESNYLLPFKYDIHPWKCYSGLTRIPINWEDDVIWSFGPLEKFNPYVFKDSGFYCFSFHPFHVYLNTPNEEYYLKCKEHYNDDSYLLKNRYKGYGTRTFLVDLLTYLKNHNITTFKLNDLVI